MTVPRIDPLIESLLCEGGTELRFETGSAAKLVLASTTVSPVRKVLGTRQIRDVIAELAPPELTGRVGSGAEAVRFPYAHPKGSVEVELVPEGDRVTARLVPSVEVDTRATTAGAPDRGAVEERQVPDTRAAREARKRPDARPTAARARRGASEVTEDAPIELPPPASMLPLDPERKTGPAKEMDALLAQMLSKDASDLHLSTAWPPYFRVDGDVAPVPGASALPLERLTAMLYSIMPARNRKELEAHNDTDFAYETPESRYRVNVFRDRVGVGSVIRQIPNRIRTAEDLGLSRHIVELCSLPKGLVLVTGPTGSGKSTTLAAMIDRVNRTRKDHIITIEDPIEFVHAHKSCLVHQREVHVHTESFKAALRAALREDPDVVLVGEMRDLETVAIAIETAETGHLVFATLHTNTAPSTVDRIIDQFPPDRQAQIRVMLAETLRGVVTQTLVKKRGGGRIAVHEVLILNPAVANLIREGKTFQIPSMMQTGRQLGMVTQTDALFELVRSGKVEAGEALNKAVAKADLRTMLEKAGLG